MRYGSLCSAAVALVFLLSAATEAEALPRMSMTSGAPCSTCHINNQGGGMRSEIGWGSMAYTGLFDYEDLGIDFLADMYSHEIVERRVAVGFDARMQMARLGRPVAEIDENGEQQVLAPDRRVIPMQLQPHVAVEVLDWLKLHGTYAAGPNTFRGELCDTPYAGQSCYMAQAIIEPSRPWPKFRVGNFQPSIGIRHDDHTMLIRDDVSRTRAPIIPANYAELGAEVSYQPKYWLRMEAGGFRADRLSQSIGNSEIVSPNDVSYLGRITWMPQLNLDESDLSFVGMFGASVFGAGSFRMENVFAGIGLLDRGSLILEAAHFGNGSYDDKDGLNLSSVLSVQAREWLIFEGRLERGWVGMDDQAYETRAAVIGLQFFPIPYVKLRPEYRYIRTDQYAMGQYTAQLHLFF